MTLIMTQDLWLKMFKTCYIYGAPRLNFL